MDTPISNEVRTHKLIVCDEQDRPRIVAQVVEGVAELRVEMPSREGERTQVLLYAADREGTNPSAIGVELWVQGVSVARMHAWCDDGEWSWTTESGE